MYEADLSKVDSPEFHKMNSIPKQAKLVMANVCKYELRLYFMTFNCYFLLPFCFLNAMLPRACFCCAELHCELHCILCCRNIEKTKTLRRYWLWKQPWRWLCWIISTLMKNPCTCSCKLCQQQTTLFILVIVNDLFVADVQTDSQDEPGLLRLPPFPLSLPSLFALLSQSTWEFSAPAEIVFPHCIPA